MGGTPGQAYEVSGWEVWMPFHGLYEEGKYAEAADAFREGRVGELRDAAVQPRLHRGTRGRKDDAMQHLRAAFAASPSDRLRATAREDSDLDPIRGEPGFQELVEGGG